LRFDGYKASLVKCLLQSGFFSANKRTGSSCFNQQGDIPMRKFRPIKSSPFNPDSILHPAWMEMERVIGLEEASKLSNLSKDSLKRHYASKIIKLSPKRHGMRVRDALMLAGK